MKTLDELKSFYKNELLADLQTLDKTRKSNSQQFYLISAIFIIPISIIFFFILPENGKHLRLYFWGFLGIIYVIIYNTFESVNKGYKGRYKKFIIKKIIKYINPTLQYYPDKQIEQSHFSNSLLYNNEDLVSYSGDDLVIGKIEKTYIRFCDIHANYDPNSYSPFQRNSNLHLRGLFFVADFNKHFRKITLIIPKKAKLKKLFFKPSLLLNDEKLKSIEIDNIEFNKHFNIYSNDAIEVRYILTPSLMEKILVFQSKTKTKIQLSFIDSNLYIIIPRSRASFEPQYFSSTISFEPIKKYFEDLQLTIGIVEDLDLNTRIWTKE